jgi:hypothetical protein
MSQQSLTINLLIASFFSASLSLAFAQAQAACSEYDQQLMTNYYQLLMSALYQGNSGAIAQLSQQLTDSLSPSCLQQMQQMQSYQGGYRGYNGYSPMPGGVPGGVMDHGDGGYSYGNVYCGSGGCVGP